jgi:hypothetical protein
LPDAPLKASPVLAKEYNRNNLREEKGRLSPPL